MPRDDAGETPGGGDSHRDQEGAAPAEPAQGVRPRSQLHREAWPSTRDAGTGVRPSLFQWPRELRSGATADADG